MVVISVVSADSAVVEVPSVSSASELAAVEAVSSPSSVVAVGVTVAVDDVSELDDGASLASPVVASAVVDVVSSSVVVSFFSCPGCSHIPNLSHLLSFLHILLQQAASTRHSPPSGRQTHPRIVQLKEQQ